MNMRFVNESKEVVVPSFVGTTKKSFLNLDNTSDYQSIKSISFYFKSESIPRNDISYTERPEAVRALRRARRKRRTSLS